ncbi:hypothetical protein FN976_26990 [Caenimonas sedimenti]|uniref:Uncharacterized protein n=1 Tax=Caenimonas sedimenti TaxID=2596921 RepID=A0A562ZFI2_9BURK|nr:hypothetical protein [Caenimonas sedimenti]TWO66027.1 hypothetical protein FN976_26990 [Caenimonas sedimenti]
MNRSVTFRSAVAAALGLAALAASTASHARGDFQISIGVPAPVYYSEPAPYYYQPSPVYVQPQPVYGHQRRGAWGDRDGDGIPNAHDRWDNSRRHVNQADRPWGDADRDGVANRYDRAPRNPYRY